MKYDGQAARDIKRLLAEGQSAGDICDALINRWCDNNEGTIADGDVAFIAGMVSGIELLEETPFGGLHVVH